MNRRQQASADHVRQLMAKSSLPRNQIAALSGLSNTYIRDLEQGNIANVGRQKLIAFAVALNLALGDIDRMLTLFDRAVLSEADIPLFLKTAEARRISSAMLPVRDDLTLGLVMLSVESVPGRHVAVSSEPTVCLRAEGHRRHTQRHLVAFHPIYGQLVEAIGRERKRRLVINLGRYPVDNFICRYCLEGYIRHCEDAVEKEWRVKHLENVVWFLNNYPDWRFHIVNTCPTFSFVLKEAAESARETDKLVVTHQPPHRFQERRSGKLVSFTTDNSIMIEHFKQELASIESAATEAYQDREALIEYLNQLVARA